MVFLFILVFLGWLFTGALCKQEFINPPPFKSIGVYTGNAGYVEGSRINILWSETEPGKKCSLVLYQVNKTSNEHFGDWEFLTRDVVDVTSYSWLVGTDKDLSESEVFFLSYYQEGKTLSSMDSRYFNITAQVAQPQPSSPSKDPSNTVPSATPEPESPETDQEFSTRPVSTATYPESSTSSSANKPASPTPSLSTNPSNSTSTSNNQSSTSPTSTDLSSSPSDTPSLPDPPGIPITGVIGICAGILVVLIIIIIAVFLCLRRRRQHRAADASSRSSQSDLNQDDNYYRPSLPEAPDRSPKEMGQLPGLWTTHPELPIRSPGELDNDDNLWGGRPELPDKPLVELGQNHQLWTGRPELSDQAIVEMGENQELWTGRPELPDKHMSVHTVRYELP